MAMANGFRWRVSGSGVDAPACSDVVLMLTFCLPGPALTRRVLVLVAYLPRQPARHFVGGNGLPHAATSRGMGMMEEGWWGRVPNHSLASVGVTSCR